VLERAATGAGNLYVRVAQDADEAAWEQFVAVCPEATFFHRYGWKRILERAVQHHTYYLLAEDALGVAGILPLAHVRSRVFANALVSLPLCVYGGAACRSEAARALLHAAAVRLAEHLGVAHLELRNLQAREPEWARQQLYVTFRRELHPELEANLLAIPRKQRAMIRKACKAGLASMVDEGVERFFELYADNLHRHGTPALPRSFFRALCAEFGPACEVLTVVDVHGVAVSAVFSFYFKDQVLPYYAGDLELARELAANDFKYWELLRRSVERGCRVFDYGRSKRGTGSFDFKRNWGFEPAPLQYEYRLTRCTTVPQNNPLNPKYRAFIALWRRLPRSVVNALGPYIARSVG
jgi:FemAB-related protein (PEP-CTERM system-associated)